MRHIVLLALLLAVQPLRADDNSDFQPGDALYAPEETSPSASAPAQAALGVSYYSTAKISVADFGHGGRLLEGADLFIDGRYVGKSPLDLGGFLIDKPAVSLSARLPGYHDAAREALRIPPDGEARIEMMGDNAASWYTTPSWVAGLLMLGGAAVAYAQNSSSGSDTGVALIGSGVGLILISQAVARLIHLPSLDRQVRALNAKSDPIP